MQNLTFSQLTLLNDVVQIALCATDLTAKQRLDLIEYYGYFRKPGAIALAHAAVLRAQSDPIHPTASSMICWLTGEVKAFNPDSYSN